jgi:hypothetical protein
MRKLIGLVIAPFVGAALLTSVVGPRLHRAQACDCAGDGFWVVEDVEVEGAEAPWPKDGHLYPERLSLWAEGTSVDLVYAP